MSHPIRSHPRARRTPVAALVLTALLAAGTALAAAPTTFTVNSDGFDFTDTSLTSGTLSFAWNGSQLQLDLASGAPVGSIPAIQLWVPASTTNDVGATVYPGAGALGDVTFGSYGNRIDSVAVTHPDVALRTVVNGYVAAFEKLGFTAETQAGGSANLVVVTFTHGDAQLRAVFHRMGADVDAYLTGVRAS